MAGAGVAGQGEICGGCGLVGQECRRWSRMSPAAGDREFGVLVDHKPDVSRRFHAGLVTATTVSCVTSV